MSKRPEDIIIEEPPIEKLSRQHSCLRRSCMSCLTFLLIIVGISLIILKFTFDAKTKELKKIPESVTRAVPVYDPDNIEKIILTAGSDRGRGAEMAAFIPKLIVAPLAVSFDRKNRLIGYYEPELVKPVAEAKTWREKFSVIMAANIADHRDELVIEWKENPTDAEFIREYYETELKGLSFAITSRSETESVVQFTFSKNDIEGSLFIEDFPKTRETDRVILTVTMAI